MEPWNAERLEPWAQETSLLTLESLKPGAMHGTLEDSENASTLEPWNHLQRSNCGNVGVFENRIEGKQTLDMDRWPSFQETDLLQP